MEKNFGKPVRLDLVPDHDEAAGVGVGQRTNQHRIDGAEHRGVDADAERERGDGDGRERRIAADLPQRKAQVAHQLLEGGQHGP